MTMRASVSRFWTTSAVKKKNKKQQLKWQEEDKSDGHVS